MSEAENLLNTLSDVEVATVDPTTEEHIVIDNNRNVHVPDALKRIAVQYDHNIETVTFDCPRYWDGIDMSGMKVYINYLRSDAQLGSYLVEEIAIDETDTNIIHFDWVISRNVTEAKGILSFLVCIKTTDDDGNEVNHWNSELNRQMAISEGLEVDNWVEGTYPDVITSLLIRMDVVETDNANTRIYIDQGIHSEVSSVIQDMVENGDIGGVDLSDYATTKYVDDMGNNINGTLSEHESSIQNNSNRISEHSDLISDLLAIKNATADYPIEVGTTNVNGTTWTYEKWASGKAICECEMNAIFKDVNGLQATSTFPFTFIEAPFAHITKIGGMGNFRTLYATTCYESSTTQISAFACNSGQNFEASDTQLLSVQVKGKWK